MGERMLGLVAGSLTGMALGSVLSFAVCAGLEHYGGVRFTKEPLILITFVGVPMGGVLGALVGRWSVTYRYERRGLDQPAEHDGPSDRHPP